VSTAIAACPGVCRGRHHQDLWRQPRDVAHAVEAVPPLAASSVELPARPVRPVRGPVALALEERAPRHRGLVLDLEHVDVGVGEVRETAGVVDIEVREHDVAHVRGSSPSARSRPTAVSDASRGAA